MKRSQVNTFHLLSITYITLTITAKYCVFCFIQNQKVVLIPVLSEAVLAAEQLLGQSVRFVHSVQKLYAKQGTGSCHLNKVEGY